MNNEELKSNVTSAKHWLRLVYMLLFAVLLYVASFVVWVLVVVQFLFSLFTGQDNIKIRQFASSLSAYIFHTLRFLTYTSEDKPFPFADWPESEVVIEAEVAAEPVVAPVVEPVVEVVVESAAESKKSAADESEDSK